MPENPPTIKENRAAPSQIAPTLSRHNIRSQILLDALQEKSVLWPYAICTTGLIYLLLYAPVLGQSRVVLLAAILAGSIGSGRLLWRLVIRYQQVYTRKLQELTALYEAEETSSLAAHMKDRYACLEQGYQEINAQDGLKVLHGLEHEYRQLQPVIQHGHESDLLSLSNLSGLVQETYLQGFNILEHALELERAAGSIDPHQIQAEIKNLERKASRQTSAGAENLRLIQEKIGFHKERLSTAANLHLRIDELLHQADRCEASLNQTHIELAALKADASDSNVNAVIVSLQKTIQRAREVQAELKKLGY